MAVVIGALILGATTAALREIDIGSTAAGFWRVALALPILLVLTAISTKSTWQLPSKHQWLPLVVAGACFAGDLIFWHLSLIHTTLGNATFLATLSSLWVPLTALVFLRQRLSRLFLLGLTCALGGSGILVASHLSIGTGSWTGDLYGLLTGFFFTGYILAVGRCRETLSTADTMLYSSALCALIDRECRCWRGHDTHVVDWLAQRLCPCLACPSVGPRLSCLWCWPFKHQFGSRDFVFRRCGCHGGRRAVLR